VALAAVGIWVESATVAHSREAASERRSARPPGLLALINRNELDEDYASGFEGDADSVEGERLPELSRFKDPDGLLAHTETALTVAMRKSLEERRA